MMPNQEPPKQHPHIGISTPDLAKQGFAQSSIRSDTDEIDKAEESEGVTRSEQSAPFTLWDV